MFHAAEPRHRPLKGVGRRGRKIFIRQNEMISSGALRGACI